MRSKEIIMIFEDILKDEQDNVILNQLALLGCLLEAIFIEASTTALNELS